MTNVKWTSGNNPTIASEFIAARENVPIESIVNSQDRLYLAADRCTGFILSAEGELKSVFSTNGKGAAALQYAMEQGARFLDCFDGFLVKFYSCFGFREVRREANWTPGGPDVVYMRTDDTIQAGANANL